MESDNLTDLAVISEKSALESIQERFTAGQIYVSLSLYISTKQNFILTIVNSTNQNSILTSVISTKQNSHILISCYFNQSDVKILSLFQRLLYFVQCSDSFVLIFQTLIGDILIAVNPFTEMYIYSKEVRHE